MSFCRFRGGRRETRLNKSRLEARVLSAAGGEVSESDLIESAALFPVGGSDSLTAASSVTVTGGSLWLIVKSSAVGLISLTALVGLEVKEEQESYPKVIRHQEIRSS